MDIDKLGNFSRTQYCYSVIVYKLTYSPTCLKEGDQLNPTS